MTFTSGAQRDTFLQDFVTSPALLFCPVCKRKCLNLRGHTEGGRGRERERARDWNSDHLQGWRRTKPLPPEPGTWLTASFCSPCFHKQLCWATHTKTQQPPRTNTPLMVKRTKEQSLEECNCTATIVTSSTLRAGFKCQLNMVIAIAVVVTTAIRRVRRKGC